MGSKNIQRVVFAELADAKAVMVLVSTDFGHKLRAYDMIKATGVRLNSAGLVEARRDIIETGELLIAVSAEFRRLHTSCECPTTDEEINQGIADVVKFVADIKADDKAAGPVDKNPAHAAEDLRKFLTASGIGGSFPGDASGLIMGLSTGNPENDGTGLYL